MLKVLNQNKMFKPLTAKIKERNIFSFDIETYDSDNKFLMGSIYGEHKSFRKDRNKEYRKTVDKVFWSKEKFISYIMNENLFYDNSVITATNLGFDFLALFEDTNILPEFNIIIRGSSIIETKFKDLETKKTLRFIDSLNFARMSVKQMGKIIGLPKLPSPICFMKKPKDMTESLEMVNYNKRDTMITYKFMKMLQTSFNDLGSNMKSTIASTAIDLFKRKYLNEIIFQKRENLLKIYKGYYGARVEALKRGYVEGLHYYDFNSLYPSVMLDNYYPNPTSEQYTKKANFTLLEDTNYEGIIKAKVKIKDIELPYLPYRQTISNDNYKLIFPKGVFTGYFSFFELRKALKLGYEILEFGESIYYTKKFKLFYEWVKDLYGKRMYYQGLGSPLEEVIKLVLNSLYGKFAQKIDNKETVIHLDNLSKEILNNFLNDTKKYKCIIRGNYIYVNQKTNNYIPSFVMPIISTYVTAYGRDKLYNKILEVGVDNTYYYDTDSLVSNKFLHTSKKLGDLKQEFPIKKGIIIAPKMYYFDTGEGEIFKAKGIPNFKKFEEHERYKRFFDMIETRMIKYDKIVKFKEANSRGFKYNQIIPIEKNLTFIDTKRLWDNDFNYDELQESESLTVIET